MTGQRRVMRTLRIFKVYVVIIFFWYSWLGHCEARPQDAVSANVPLQDVIIYNSTAVTKALRNQSAIHHSPEMLPILKD